MTQHRWLARGLEPKLSDLLDDPLTRLVMRRDGVTWEELHSVVLSARQKLQASQGFGGHVQGRLADSVALVAGLPGMDATGVG